MIILCLGNKSQLYNTVIDGRSIEKNYKEVAITSLVNHNFVIENASQFFLKEGPFAILPLKKNLFSIVWSVNENFFLENKTNLNNLLKTKLKKIMGSSFKSKIKNLENFPIFLSLKKNISKKIS